MSIDVHDKLASSTNFRALLKVRKLIPRGTACRICVEQGVLHTVWDTIPLCYMQSENTMKRATFKRAKTVGLSFKGHSNRLLGGCMTHLIRATRERFKFFKML